MSKIIQLDEHLSNMIAAGEVVERISSVVKELVENSLDAKADDIIVELQDSGIKEIKVLDNGCGMDIDDIKCCYQRHATSKIKNQYDLFRIQTLGFRGEAIPSIASVSDMVIKSNCGDTGYFIHLRATKKIEEGYTPLNKGTEITVSNLFYNTPARLKFLKSENIELASICEVIDKLALSNPSVRFKLINDKKIIFQTSGNNDMKSIIGNIYGLPSIKNMLEVSNSINGIKIKCFLGDSTINKARKNAITLIVNGRFVKNYSIVNSIVEGYDTFIPSGRYPLAVVFITIDPILIDVNVHPTKQEIRISDEEVLRTLITSTIKNALEKTSHIPLITEKEQVLVNDTNDSQKRENQNNHLSNISFDSPNSSYIAKLAETKFESQTFFEEKQEKLDKKLPYLEYVGQYAGTYLLFQNSLGLYLMDQHAAAERIRYEKYIEELSNPKPTSQELLIPELIETTRDEAIFIKNSIQEFADLGLVLDELDDKSFYLRAVPVWITNDPVTVAEEMIKYIIEKRTIDIKSIRDDLAKTISCKGAIKANRNMELTEINTLVEQLSNCKNPFTCPHGRPTIISFTEYEIKKMFLRVM